MEVGNQVRQIVSGETQSEKNSLQKNRTDEWLKM
jgi:hypothetical protein